MNAREVKGLELTGDLRIAFQAGVWTVPSQSTAGVAYTVNPGSAAPSCTCEDFQLRNQPCKHIEAVRRLLDRQIKGEPNPKPEEVPARPLRPTYAQDWANYDAAQVKEKDHFQTLLADLCAAIPEPPFKHRMGSGRKPVPLRDAFFGALLKVYGTLSGRRSMSDLREAYRRGHVGTQMSYKIPAHALERPDASDILLDMIRRSSLPLRSVETVFSPDSTGFGTSKFEKWYDEKYSVTRRQCLWVKVHCMAGAKTGVVTAAVISDKLAGDSPQLPELLQKTADNFAVREVPADKAYLSADNLARIEAVGGTPYIPFKINSALGNTPTWDRLFHYFNLHREEFLTHYHQRSNIESVFSAVKRKFGDAVRARSDSAQKAETLAKLVCHNICVLIAAWYELGIEPGAWGPIKREAPVLGVVRPG
jgi:transposase